jgi:hypothetical protein
MTNPLRKLLQRWFLPHVSEKEFERLLALIIAQVEATAKAKSISEVLDAVRLRHPDFDPERVHHFWLTHPHSHLMWPNESRDPVSAIDEMWHLLTNTPGCAKMGERKVDGS